MGAAENIVNLLKETMENWKTNSICNNTDIGTVKINRNICWEQMKISVKTEYFKLVRPDLKSKLNAGNVFWSINIWAIPTVQYWAPLIQWTKKIHHHTWVTSPKFMWRQTLHSKKWWRRKSGKWRGLCRGGKVQSIKTAAVELNLEKYVANLSKTEKKENRLK